MKFLFLQEVSQLMNLFHKFSAIPLCLAALTSACGGAGEDGATDDGQVADSVDALVEDTTIVEELPPEQKVVNGVAPSPAIAADPLLLERNTAAQRYSQSFATDLAFQLDSSDETSAFSSSAVEALAVSKGSVSITGEKQQKSYWCVPASSRITLSALRSSPPTQKTLASKEHTSAAIGGTVMTNVAPVLNSYQTKNHFLYSNDTPSSSNLVTRVRYDIDSLRSPLIPAIQGSYLPAWKQRGYSGSHAIVIYGWNVATKKPYNLNVYDPLNVKWSGAYNVPASTIYAALKANGKALVW